MALKRKGFQKDVKLIANSSSEQCIAALKSSAGQPGEVRNANMEALSNNEKTALELRTALRQVLISTKDVPLTDGYKRNLRHESHNLNIAEGALAVFATFNFADNYAPLLFQLVRGGSDGSVEHIGEDIVCRLTDDAPNMPSFQQMQQLMGQVQQQQQQQQQQEQALGQSGAQEIAPLEAIKEMLNNFDVGNLDSLGFEFDSKGQSR